MSTPNPSDPKPEQTAPEKDLDQTTSDRSSTDPTEIGGAQTAGVPGQPSASDAASSDAEKPEDTPAPDADEESFAEMLSEFEQQHQGGEIGQTVAGTVLEVAESVVIVDVGLKREGLLPREEIKGEEIRAGETIQVTVARQAPEGYYRLSRANVAVPKDWSGLENAYSSGSVISGTVTSAIKGGLSVDVGARAFLPASRSGTRDAAEMETLVGQEIRCKVIQLDTAKEDVVVDRRAVLEQEAREARERLVGELQPGIVVTGTVRSLTDFGAFIDIGGVDGLLHVADMAWHRVQKPADVLKQGEEIEVKVLKVDPASQRISLGRKQLVPDPWSQVEEKYAVGERVQGKVVRLTDFGAFVQLEPGVDGMIHISEMSWSRKIKKPGDVVKLGEVVEAVVLSANAAQRRIGLGLKQALGDPWEDVETRFPVGGVVEGKITNMAKFGAFVELAEGLEGMIHIADISNEKRLNHPNEELSEGQEVKAMVLEIDRGRKRIRLGLKQLQPTSADEYIAEHKVGDIVTGRVIEGRKKSIRVELGEGVVATCRKTEKKSDTDDKRDSGDRPDLSALTEMLAAKWKAGSVPKGGSESGELRAGEVQNFRIVALDPSQKRIELEIAE